MKLKTGMVEQLGRDVRNIWCYVTRKKHDVAQKQICKKKKKENRVCVCVCVGGGGCMLLKKAETRITSLSVKINGRGGGVYNM